MQLGTMGLECEGLDIKTPLRIQATQHWPAFAIIWDFSAAGSWKQKRGSRNHGVPSAMTGPA